MASPAPAARTAVDETSASGAFVRTPAAARSTIAAGTRHPPAGDRRYWLVASYACPWANRAVCVRSVRGLQAAVGLAVVHPTWQRTRPGDPADTHTGWVFCPPHPPTLPTPAGHGSVSVGGLTGPPPGAEECASVRDLYQLDGGPAFAAGKFSVPVLWDSAERAVVCNESADICRILGGPAFEPWAAPPPGAVADLCPPADRALIDEVNAWVYDGINNGVYKAGFARTQAAYDDAAGALLAALRRAEAHLATSRFLAGPTAMSEADIRLVQTLVRYDPVYLIYFKCAAFGFIKDSPVLRDYVRDVYAQPGMAPGDTVRLDHIKAHYFTSHPVLNAYGIIPAGPVPDAEGKVWWEEALDGSRAGLGGGGKEA